MIETLTACSCSKQSRCCIATCKWCCCSFSLQSCHALHNAKVTVWHGACQRCFTTCFPTYILCFQVLCRLNCGSITSCVFSEQIKDLGVKAGIVLNPATPLETIQHVIPSVDLILLMSGKLLLTPALCTTLTILLQVVHYIHCNFSCAFITHILHLQLCCAIVLWLVKTKLCHSVDLLWSLQSQSATTVSFVTPW